MISRWRLQVRDLLPDQVDWMEAHGYSMSKGDREWYVNHSRLDSVDTPYAAMDVGVRLLREISGYYRLEFHRKLDAVLVGILEIHDGNLATSHLMPVWVDYCKFGTPSVSSTGLARRYQPLGHGVAFQGDALTRAMQFHGDLTDNPTNDWQILHKVNEIAYEHLKDLADRWIDPASRKRMRDTANDPNSVGDGARHAKLNAKPADNPMTYADARSTIDSLLRGWIKWESEQ